MTDPAVAPGASSLKLRILSSLVLAPVALAAAWAGSPWLPAIAALAAGIMAWEWARLVRHGRFGASGALIVAVAVLAVLAAGFGRAGTGLAIAALGAGLVLAVSRGRGEEAPGWAALGTLWVAVPCIALVWLARDPLIGRATLLWVLGVVWATDSGAYAVGRSLGGPRLAPRLSPRKTWSGLVGGVASATLVGGVTARLMDAPLLPMLVASAGLAVIEQLGDIAESAAKRRFGAKDSSGLIPGHGGLLDRLDGMLAVVTVVALIDLIGGGGVLSWR